jgi:hypothetical protein
LIRLSFTFSGIPVFVRAAFFRICADRTLRGPDGTLVATYSSLGWWFGTRNYREFEAVGPLFLRASCLDGRTEHLGPYENLRAADGSIFTRTSCLGTFCADRAASAGAADWNEITLLDRAG